MEAPLRLPEAGLIVNATRARRGGSDSRRPDERFPRVTAGPLTTLAGEAAAD